MTNRLKLATMLLILTACCFLAGDAKADYEHPNCVYPTTLWCIGGTDGNPMFCYCAVKP